MIAGLFCVHLFSGGCAGGPDELAPGEYVSWIECAENGLRPSKTINGYTFDLLYKPCEYVVMRENLYIPSSAEEMMKETEAIGDMQYFTLRISKEGNMDLLSDDAGTMDVFSSRLMYFTNLMQYDISLVENGDTLPCSLFHFERTYAVDPHSTFLLGFPKSTTVSDGSLSKTFVFKDRELGTGPIILAIEQENIERIPSLKLN